MRSLDDIARYFKELQREALEKVAECARNQSLVEVVRFTRVAEECEKALQQVLALERTAVRIEDLRSSPSHVQGLPSYAPMSPLKDQREAPLAMVDDWSSRSSGQPKNRSSKKLVAARQKESWVERLERQESVKLLRVEESGKSVFRTTLGGYRLGISFANEGEQGGKWWLGLPEDGYDFLVLLCRTRDGRILDFVIPVREVSDEGLEGILSRSGGQYKINVRSEGDGYFLLIPNRGKKSIGEYLGRSDFLKCIVLPEDSGKQKGEEP